jgi:predicted lipoprotein with Yx(FWY)xxD motif
MRKSISSMAILAALAGSTLLTACGTDTAQRSAPTDSSNVAATPVLRVVDSNLGPVVADQSGHTLYAFTKDTNGVSTCYDACATAWPAALASDTTLTGSGVADQLIGTADRTDGTKQLTLNGMPLYRFAADGDTTGALKGQGNKSVWFVLDSSGSLIKNAAPVATTTPTTVKKSSSSSYNYSYDY